MGNKQKQLNYNKWVFKSLWKAAVGGASLMFLGNSFHAYAAAMLLEVLSSNGS